MNMYGVREKSSQRYYLVTLTCVVLKLLQETNTARHWGGAKVGLHMY